jgi:pimeloyl-ACP methyl ester carboxylesterase
MNADVAHQAQTDCVAGADAVRIVFTRAGSGPPVVLLHGFPEDRTAWRNQISPLAAAGLTVIVPDLRGYGASDKPKGVGAYRLRALADDVAAIAASTGASRIHLVGHDWGGIVAWAFAAQHPKLLDRLVILNAPHPQLYLRALYRSSQLFKSWYAIFFQLPWLPERLLAANDHALLRQIYRRGTVRGDAFTPQDIEHYFDAFREPQSLTAALNYYRANARPLGKTSCNASPIEAETLVIWGERDPALSIRLLDGVQDVAPNATVHRIADSGHFVQREAADEVNRLLLTFLLA